MRLYHYGATLALLATQASAQSNNLSKFCPSSDVCYQLNIPEQTAKSGSGDVYFQISGSTDYSWIGLGQGTGMIHANIFVMYQDGKGNVTVSPRYATAYAEPDHDDVAQFTLLEGSGVADGRMTANIKCTNCQKWKYGSMNFKDDSGSFIYAYKSGSSIDSTSPEAQIEEHDDKAVFNWKFASAKGGPSDLNPFASSNGGVSTPPTSGGDSAAGGVTVSEPPSVSDTMITAHGVLASLAFLVFFPFGAIFIRTEALSSRLGGYYTHAFMQLFAYAVFTAGAGLGIYIAKTQEQLTVHHPVIGMVLFGLFFFQPFLGVIHHKWYKRVMKRTVTSYGHIWIGRGGIILGMINGGLGLQLSAPDNTGYYVGYGVVAGVVGLIYVLVIALGEMKRKKKVEAILEEKGRIPSDNEESS